MSDRERHVFDMRFRRAVNAYDRFEQALGRVAGCWDDDEYPDDWGVMVQQVMAHIRTAKMLLTRAMSDAQLIVRDSSVEQDELMELNESLAGLNNRLQHVDSVEAVLMNSILRGDGDYVSMFIASQRVQQEMEERIQQTVRGPVPEDAPEEQPEEPEEDVAEEEQEDVGDTSDDTPGETPDDESEETGQEETSEDDTSGEEAAPEEQPTEVPDPQEANPFDFHERARLYGEEAIQNGTYDIHEGADDEEEDDDPEAPIIIPVEEEPAPVEEPKPRELTTEEKIDLIRNDPELQRLIHDAAQDIAIRQVQDMIEDAKAAAVEQQPQAVVEKPRIVPTYVTEEGRPYTPEELAAASGEQPEADEPTGFVGRIRGKKADKPKDKPSKPSKTPRRIGRKNTGGEQ